jgi:hypothetical protein
MSRRAAKEPGARPGKEQAPARAGTARFRREVRTTWQRVMVVGGDEDDLMAATPFKAGARAGELRSDAALDAALAGIQTPVVTFRFGLEGGADGARDDDEDDDNERHAARPSPSVLIEIDRNTLDAYLAGMVKQTRRRAVDGSKRARPAASTPPARLPSTSAAMALQSQGVAAFQTPGGTVRVKVQDAGADEEEAEEEEDDA